MVASDASVDWVINPEFSEHTPDYSITIVEVNPRVENAKTRFRWLTIAYEILSDADTRRFWHRRMQRRHDPVRYGYARIKPVAKSSFKGKGRQSTPASTPKAAVPRTPSPAGSSEDTDSSDGDPEDVDELPQAPNEGIWKELCRLYGLSYTDDDAYTYLKLVFPDIGGSDLSILHVAFALIQEGQCLRVPWEPMPPSHDPSAPTSYLRELPKSWGVEDGVNFMHATHPYLLPSIRKFGLRCGRRGEGAGCKWNHRQIYTFKTRRPAYSCYMQKACIKLHFPDGRPGFIEKHFIVFVGIGGLGHWPYARKVQRRPNWKSQFVFRPGQYKPLWLEFIPVRADEDLPIPSFTPSVLSESDNKDKRNIKRWVQKETRARILFYDLLRDKSVQERETPMPESTPNWYKEQHAEDVVKQPSGRNRPVVPPWRQGREAASSSRGYSPDRSRSAQDTWKADDDSDDDWGMWWTDRPKADDPPWKQARRAAQARCQEQSSSSSSKGDSKQRWSGGQR